jgi:predicted Zn finger-like uncharacterized protein
MDVRCDRCQTEYELDDESVAGAGASVQCTTCGHTFVVTRAGSVVIGTTPPGGLSGGETPGPVPRLSQPALPQAGTGSTPPPVPEWVLTTEEGQTHRLRDLTTLQKWIVERRVTRADRVSQRGGAWRQLGDVDELRPFFDVVDQADRQTGPGRVSEAARAVRPTLPATPRKMQSSMRPHMSPDLDDDDVLSSSSSGSRSRGDGSRFMDVGADIGTDEDLSFALRPRRTGLKVLGGVVFLGLAGAAWYVGFRDPHGFRLASGAPMAAAPAPVAAAPVPPPPAPVAAPTPPPVPAAAPIPAAAAPAAPVPAPPAAAAPVVAAAPPPAAAPVPVAAAPPAPGLKASTETAAAPKSYEHLVGEADHALENGQTGKAQKLYDEAMRLQPQGVAAMTGSAYVLMDKRRPLAAIGLFKQALSNAPNYAPALFGLGEAYRGEGDVPQAIEAYKRYLEQSPTGTDAPAARRQIKELGESAAPRPTGPSAVVPEGARSEPMAPIAPTSPPSAN